MMTSLVLFLGLVVQDPAPDPRVKPGEGFILPFPGLPQTLGKRPSELHVRFPRKYDPKKKFPMLLWINGGNGDPGVNPIVGEDGWILVSLPLYKVNPASTPAVMNEDAALIWSCYRTMLAELE